MEKAKVIKTKHDLIFKMNRNGAEFYLHDRIKNIIPEYVKERIHNQTVNALEENEIVIAFKFEGHTYTLPDPARAPYNFIQLNNKIVPAKQQGTSNVNNSLSGYIEIQIKTKTPLFIRNNKEDENFFTINGELTIPGSSIRGMIRNLVEIVSWSELKFFDNRRLSHRGMADKAKRLQNIYKNEISTEEKAGILKYEETTRKYFIYPADLKGRFPVDKARKKIEVEYNPLEKVWYIHSGLFSNKKQQNWKIGLPNGKSAIPVPDIVVQDYLSDSKSRTEDVDLIEWVKDKNKFPDGVPVFYNDDSTQVISFGHTRNYRVPYDYKIGDHVKQDWANSNEEKIDFAHAIFGDSEITSTKVFFEDAICFQKHNEVIMERYVTQLLLSPKPTTFQHYLEQPFGTKTQMEELEHWGDNEAHIRGNKLYWHRNTSANTSDNHSWVKKHLRRDEVFDQTTGTEQFPIRAVKEEVVFSSRIRFDNLIEEELGCLLFALQLPEGCCHKLGMGKPLGLGSVHITPSLTLIDRKERYSTIFDKNNSWHTAEEKEDDLQQYKDAFAQYIGNYLDEKPANAEALWNNNRLRELKIMLTLNHNVSDWLERTSYQTLEEFKQRLVLPKPSEITKPKTYNI